jgi:hypothetical protein
MIDYIIEIIENQVVFTLNTFDNPSFDTYTSSDGFLSIVYILGQSSGTLGYGAMQIYLYDKSLPLVLSTPYYEHEQDLLDVVERINKNMEELKNGNILS